MVMVWVTSHGRSTSDAEFGRSQRSTQSPKLAVVRSGELLVSFVCVGAVAAWSICSEPMRAPLHQRQTEQPKATRNVALHESCQKRSRRINLVSALGVP
jgi:hypothetical protein